MSSPASPIPLSSIPLTTRSRHRQSPPITAARSTGTPTSSSTRTDRPASPSTTTHAPPKSAWRQRGRPATAPCSGANRRRKSKRRKLLNLRIHTPAGSLLAGVSLYLSVSLKSSSVSTLSCGKGICLRREKWQYRFR